MTVTLATLMERLENLNATLVGGDLVDLAIAPAAAGLLLAIRNRVKNKGEATDGSQLRKYSTKQMYAAQSQFVGGGFFGYGKTSANDITLDTYTINKLRKGKLEPTKKGLYNPILVRKNYQQRKSMYLPGGYKELRDIQGLRTDITNMSYGGQMLNDYQEGRQGDAIVLGLTTQRSADVYNGQAYGTGKMAGRGVFLQASASEIEEFEKRALFSLKRLTVGIILEGETLGVNIGQ